MKRYVVGVSSRYFFLRDGDESKDICAFQVGDYVKIKALFMPELSAYIEEIVITKNRTFLMLSSKVKDSAGAIPVDLIEHMEILEEGKC